MRVIIPAAPLVKQVIGKQKRIRVQNYRLMTYVIQCPVEDGVLLYHMLTRCMLLLTHEEAADITTQQDLIDFWFLVPEEHDDRKLCQQIRQMAQLFKPSSKHITGYTILTTTGCNARCFYCYEKGTKPINMTTETANKVSQYIIEHRGEENVKISWFGGEPLVNSKVIDLICTHLKEHKVPFKSKMTSNGFLFDAKMIQRAKELWQLQNVQITLDGKEQTYNRVKRYIYEGVNAFERVLKNIKLLTTAGIHVQIRLNVDQHNINEMSELVSQLHQHFGTNKYLSIYSHELFGKRTPKDNATLYKQRMQLERHISEYGYKEKRELQKDIKLNCCMADNDQSVVIVPDGHLSKCEHYIDREFFGHIDSEERDANILQKFKEHPSDIDACANCPCYPQCIRLTMCEIRANCTPEIQKEHFHDTKEAMKDEYLRYLNRNDNNKNEQEDETEI